METVPPQKATPSPRGPLPAEDLPSATQLAGRLGSLHQLGSLSPPQPARELPSIPQSQAASLVTKSLTQQTGETPTSHQTQSALQLASQPPVQPAQELSGFFPSQPAGQPGPLPQTPAGGHPTQHSDSLGTLPLNQLAGKSGSLPSTQPAGRFTTPANRRAKCQKPAVPDSQRSKKDSPLETLVTNLGEEMNKLKGQRTQPAAHKRTPAPARNPTRAARPSSREPPTTPASEPAAEADEGTVDCPQRESIPVHSDPAGGGQPEGEVAGGVAAQMPRLSTVQEDMQQGEGEASGGEGVQEVGGGGGDGRGCKVRGTCGDRTEAGGGRRDEEVGSDREPMEVDGCEESEGGGGGGSQAVAESPLKAKQMRRNPGSQGSGNSSTPPQPQPQLQCSGSAKPKDPWEEPQPPAQDPRPSQLGEEAIAPPPFETDGGEGTEPEKPSPRICSPASQHKLQLLREKQVNCPPKAPASKGAKPLPKRATPLLTLPSFGGEATLMPPNPDDGRKHGDCQFSKQVSSEATPQPPDPNGGRKHVAASDSGVKSQGAFPKPPSSSGGRTYGPAASKGQSSGQGEPSFAVNLSAPAPEVEVQSTQVALPGKHHLPDAAATAVGQQPSAGPQAMEIDQPEPKASPAKQHITPQTGARATGGDQRGLGVLGKEGRASEHSKEPSRMTNPNPFGRRSAVAAREGQQGGGEGAIRNEAVEGSGSQSRSAPQQGAVNMLTA